MIMYFVLVVYYLQKCFMEISYNDQKIRFTALIAAFFLFPCVTLAASPTVTLFSPADDEIGVDRNTNLVLTFDQTVIASGSTLATPSRIRIFNQNGVIFEDINASGAQVTVSTTTVTINPLLTFVVDADYYVQIEADAFVNAADESFVAIADSTTWNFKILGNTGGAAARQAREKRLLNTPAHYDMEPPCPVDVGIFIPNSSCGNSDDAVIEDSPQKESKIESETVHTAAPTPVKPVISPALEEARLKRDARLSQPMKQSATTPSVQNYESNLHKRACGRVAKRFSGNQKMIDRINDRLGKRFGFMCEL